MEGITGVEGRKPPRQYVTGVDPTAPGSDRTEVRAVVIQADGTLRPTTPEEVKAGGFTANLHPLKSAAAQHRQAGKVQRRYVFVPAAESTGRTGIPGGRNAPCPCWCGRKSKRCIGLTTG